MNINIIPLVWSADVRTFQRWSSKSKSGYAASTITHNTLRQYTHHIVENTLNKFAGTLMFNVYIHVSSKQKRGTCVTSEPSYNNYLITSACTDKVLTAIAVNTIGNRDKLN